MNELSLMIKNLLDMECEHIYKGYISKEKAKKAIEAFILNFVVEGNTVDIRRVNQIFGSSNKAYSKAQMLDAFLTGLKINANQIEKLEEKYKKLSKSVFELKGEFMACPLDNTKRLGELIDQLNNL